MTPDQLPPPVLEPGKAVPDAPGMPQVEIDWWAYWARFKEAHGMPVEHGGRLLFPDGWTYGRDDPAGPEWPPPSGDALTRLLIAYWLVRLRIVKAEAFHLQELVRNLRQLQAGKSMPLQQAVRRQPGEGTAPRSASVDVDAIEQGRLAWLRDDVELCEFELRRLQEGL